MSLSFLARQQILRQQMHAKFPYLIEITVDETVYRYANTDEDITFNGNTYEACCFSVGMPERTESKIGDGRLTLSTIYDNGAWIKRVRQMSKRGSVRVIAVIIYSAGNVIDAIESIDGMEYQLTNASWNDTELSWTMKFDEGMDIVMPCDTMDEIICPGVV